MNTIQDCWERFNSTVVPTMKAEDLRERNARRAFYAGAIAVLAIQQRLAHMSNEAFILAMDTISQECHTHVARIGLGEE